MGTLVFREITPSEMSLYFLTITPAVRVLKTLAHKNLLTLRILTTQAFSSHFLLFTPFNERLLLETCLRLPPYYFKSFYCKIRRSVTQK